MTTPAPPIIGQQAIVFYKHAQTLGIVTAYKDDFPHQWIRVRVPNGVELQFSPGNVELIKGIIYLNPLTSKRESCIILVMESPIPNDRRAK